MMHGRRLAPYEDDERVVYYDLETDSHSRDLMLSPDAVSAPAQPRVATTTATKAAGEGGGSQVFPRQQQPLFNLDDSGDEAEGVEENPFATLLQQQQQTQQTATLAAEADEAACVGTTSEYHGNSLVSVAATTKEETGRGAIGRGGTRIGNTNGGNRRSILKHSHQRSVMATRVGTGAKAKKLGFEAAGSRPDRWSTGKPSSADTKNRRKSLGAIQKRRSQLEASAAKRRKSMPAGLSGSQTTQNRSSVDGNFDTSPSAPKTRLLSDVLQRATTLSQQQNSTNEDSSFSQAKVDENPTEADAILDTEHQMRAEPFAPQIFSPTKPVGGGIGRKSKDESIISKIRGSMGDVIRKAIRKRNRDLTLLRSHGQHLLPQQSSHSSLKGVIGAMESIQDRACIMVRLMRRCAVTPHSVSYECQIHEVAATLEKTTASALKGKNLIVKAIFHPQAAKYLKLSIGTSLKIYEPLRFVEEEVAVGSTSKPEWFLLSTQLTEVVATSDDSHPYAD
ncbi:hypothetical protein PC129_g3106 [Phytophthora cactorum]|uniref:Uncharacterized protein n=1 Tax=Phytophthora cactorum TaxID=29920 RepID=A0A329SUR5_9STRA|nr:hypothetical protein Pcac1_g22335 [Phytophthora cactorum]KAG2836636.1 hypothetical protein PC112_g5206 [Phytophthora cactorum]KAG2839408.1 hypothetical protein PC111_g3854 [Phytophthora cactorum]KAG2864048.1 hypothetical protein PC113_g4894 [Phytophthora cactorum]KAG2925587.1 hypothetical protein PC114_g4052 [Phytophthora cactorum]